MDVNALFLLFLIFCFIIRINIRIGVKKIEIFNFFFNLPSNNVGRPVNQSIIKKT